MTEKIEPEMNLRVERWLSVMFGARYAEMLDWAANPSGPLRLEAGMFADLFLFAEGALRIGLDVQWAYGPGLPEPELILQVDPAARDWKPLYYPERCQWMDREIAAHLLWAIEGNILAGIPRE